LGQIFAPVPGTAVLFCIWDARVQDFAAFVQDTKYDATKGLWSLGRDGLKQHGDSWKHPGFDQGLTHPVCGVSWNDAQAFCHWLTDRERRAGLLAGNQAYRLPKDSEWSQAVGGGLYPWGNAWPPPPASGNYAGAEAVDANWPKLYQSIAGYRDPYPRTSPVGSFAPNSFGLFDMGGNVWQWCDDFYRKEMNQAETRRAYRILDDDGGGRQYRVLRGASWFETPPLTLTSGYRFLHGPDDRTALNGFRTVVAWASRP
jgi:formylglycine-generating enzyme required for sulfatase activity